MTMPNPATSTNQERLQQRLEDLKTLKDQIRVDLQLAKLELQDEWKSLEQRLPDRARVASELKSATAEMVDNLADELRRFRDRLRKNTRPHA
jgi:predicted alpha/beta superfamily hydrolase